MAEAQIKQYVADMIALEKSMWMDADGKTKTAEEVKKLMAESMYPDEGVIYIRPSGNPLTQEAMLGMMTGGDAQLTVKDLLEVSHVRVFGNAAVCVYTTREKFVYKGTPNDDVATYSATLSKNDAGNWMFQHVHRGSGQPPKDA